MKTRVGSINKRCVRKNKWVSVEGCAPALCHNQITALITKNNNKGVWIVRHKFQLATHRLWLPASSSGLRWSRRIIIIVIFITIVVIVIGVTVAASIIPVTVIIIIVIYKRHNKKSQFSQLVPIRLPWLVVLLNMPGKESSNDSRQRKTTLSYNVKIKTLILVQNIIYRTNNKQVSKYLYTPSNKLLSLHQRSKSA